MEKLALRRVLIRLDAEGRSPDPVVLFVTDDEDFRAAAERGLAEEGYDVVSASHAGHALLACLVGKPVDVLVTEMSMPDMLGPQLAQRIRRYCPDLPVVYLAQPGTRPRDGVLVRPFTRDDLVRQLSHALTPPTSTPLTAGEEPSPAS
jgi:CheY-like chemotaxis protein